MPNLNAPDSHAESLPLDKKLKKLTSSGSPGVVSKEKRKDEDPDEESRNATSTPSSDLVDQNPDEESPADKMMRFFTGKPCKERSKKSKAIKFPLKLMYVLECGDFTDIISWSRNGLSFKVERPNQLETRVLPAIFKDAKFSSFRRKLNRWSFKRNRTAAHFTVSHPLFRRGDFRLCQMMSCSKSDDISLPGPSHSALLHPDAGQLIDSQLNGTLADVHESRTNIPSSLQRAETALLAGSLHPQRYGGGNLMVQREDDLAYALRARENMDSNYGMHGDSMHYSSLALPRARLQQQIDPMLMSNRSSIENEILQRQLLARDLNDLPPDVMMELQLANRNPNIDLLRNLGVGMSGLSSQNAMINHQHLLRERNIAEDARNFPQSMEEVMLAQGGMRRAYNNNPQYHQSNQDMYLARQQQATRDRVGGRNADRIITDAMDILRHAP